MRGFYAHRGGGSSGGCNTSYQRAIASDIPLLLPLLLRLLRAREKAFADTVASVLRNPRDTADARWTINASHLRAGQVRITVEAGATTC